MRGNYDNTGKLVRFFFRRERIASTVWIGLLCLFSVMLAPMLANLFDEKAREALVATLNNPAMISMLGPIYGNENYTSGAMYFNMMVQWMMIAVAIMNILLVVRHTRGDEERGRMDMLRALPTGRLANLNAVMVVAVAENLLIALLTGIGVAVMGIEHMGLNGSLLYGAVLGVAGLVFAGIAAVFSQLCSTSRGAIGLSVVVLGFFYLLRAAGDIGNEVFAYISPLGLAQRAKAYVENDWLPIVILLLEAAVLFLVAYALNAMRDVKQGFIPQRKGRNRARRYLCSPYGLAFRLLLLPFVGWIVGMFIIGAAYGSILGNIETFVQSSEFYSLMIGSAPGYTTAQMFVSMVTSIMALIAVVPVLMMVLKIRGEEKDGYAEPVLSRAVSRQTYMASYTLLAVVTSVLLQCASAMGIYVSAVAVLPDPGTLTLGYLLKANLVYLPALWVMIGITVLLIGVVPRMTAVVWAYFGFSFLVIYMRKLPDLFPSWVADLTPFGHIPNLPMDEIHYGTLAVLTVIAICLMAAGFVAYRRRDITAG